jgi:hypothetical protein
MTWPRWGRHVYQAQGWCLSRESRLATASAVPGAILPRPESYELPVNVAELVGRTTSVGRSTTCNFSKANPVIAVAGRAWWIIATSTESAWRRRHGYCVAANWKSNRSQVFLAMTTSSTSPNCSKTITKCHRGNSAADIGRAEMQAACICTIWGIKVKGPAGAVLVIR